MYSFLPSAFRIRRRFGRRVAHGVPFDGPGSASMALEAPFRAPSCFWAEQWVGFVQFELKILVKRDLVPSLTHVPRALIPI